MRNISYQLVSDEFILRSAELEADWCVLNWLTLLYIAGVLAN